MEQVHTRVLPLTFLVDGLEFLVQTRSRNAGPWKTSRFWWLRLHYSLRVVSRYIYQELLLYFPAELLNLITSYLFRTESKVASGYIPKPIMKFPLKSCAVLCDAGFYYACKCRAGCNDRWRWPISCVHFKGQVRLHIKLYYYSGMPVRATTTV